MTERWFEDNEAPRDEDENEGGDEVPVEDFREDMVDYGCRGLHMGDMPIR
jgi:hypothetical protein